VKPAWWDAAAGNLQRVGRDSEGLKAEEFSDGDARRAAVYTREDLILVVSYLSSLNRQIALLIRIVLAIAIIAAVVAARYLL